MESGGEREDMSGEWRREGGYEWRVSKEGGYVWRVSE